MAGPRLIVNNLVQSLHEHAKFTPIVSGLLRRKIVKTDVYGAGKLDLAEILGCAVSKTTAGFSAPKLRR